MLIFEDCANSAPSARFLPLPRRFFCVRMARDASGGMFRMRRKDGAICGAASAAPRAISFLRRNGAECLRRLIFLHQPVRNASGGILFSGLSEKSMQKRDAGERNSAYAPEKLFVSLYVLSFCFRRLNALRAAVGSGFPSARHAVQVALFAPVEYLTYGSRKAVLFTRAAMHIAHKRTSAQGTSETDAEYFDYNADLSNTHLHRVL